MKNNLNLLMDTILGAPAWIQEALYIDLGEKLKEKSGRKDSDAVFNTTIPFIPD